MANAADELRRLAACTPESGPDKATTQTSRGLRRTHTPRTNNYITHPTCRTHHTAESGRFIDIRQLIPLLVVRFFESIPFPIRNTPVRDAGFPRLSARDRHRLVLTQALILYIHRKVSDQILDEQVNRREVGPSEAGF